MKVRTYIGEPERGPRVWAGKEAEKRAVYGNRRRIGGARGKRLMARRGERIERNFAHQFDTGGMDRLWVRGRENVHKKLLIQAAACNLALMLRARFGSGKPKAAHDKIDEVIFTCIQLLIAIWELGKPEKTHGDVGRRKCRRLTRLQKCSCNLWKSLV